MLLKEIKPDIIQKPKFFWGVGWSKTTYSTLKTLKAINSAIPRTATNSITMQMLREGQHEFESEYSIYKPFSLTGLTPEIKINSEK